MRPRVVNDPPAYEPVERVHAAAPAAVAEAEEVPLDHTSADPDDFADAVLLQADEELPQDDDVPDFGYTDEPHVPFLVRALARLGVFSVRDKDGREII